MIADFKKQCGHCETPVVARLCRGSSSARLKVTAIEVAAHLQSSAAAFHEIATFSDWPLRPMARFSKIAVVRYSPARNVPIIGMRSGPGRSSEDVPTRILEGGAHLQNRALSDLRVVEYAEMVSGPMCGKMFADMGAEVIKLEPPGRGDEARSHPPYPGDVPHPEKSG